MKKILFLFIFLLPFKLYADVQKIKEFIFGWQMGEAAELVEKMENPPEYIMGLYKFYCGNYKEAHFYFKQSPEEYRWWLNLIEEILPVTQNFKTIESDCFVIRYTGKDKILAIYLKGILEISAKKLSEKFNWKPQDKVILEIFPDRRSFQAASTLTDKHIKVSGAIGICKFNRVMIASPRILKFGYTWADTATHEYVHYIIGRITGLKNVPLWFNEGLAKYLEVIWRKDGNELEPVDINFLIKARNSGSWVGFEKMKHGMPTLDTGEDVTLAFAQVQSMIDFLVTEYGWDKIRELIYKLKNDSADGAFREVYKKPVQALRKDWEEYIKDIEWEITPGARCPSYAFNEDPVNAISEWVSETAMTDIRIARRLKDAGKYKHAIRKFCHALGKDPGNAVILNMLAKVQVITGEKEKAKENFLFAIRSNPSYAPAYLHMGKLLIAEKNFIEAEEYIMKYVYICPFNPESHRLLLDIYKKTDKRKAKREKQISGILDEN